MRCMFLSIRQKQSYNYKDICSVLKAVLAFFGIIYTLLVLELSYVGASIKNGIDVSKIFWRMLLYQGCYRSHLVKMWSLVPLPRFRLWLSKFSKYKIQNTNRDSFIFPSGSASHMQENHWDSSTKLHFILHCNKFWERLEPNMGHNLAGEKRSPRMRFKYT